MPDTTLDADRRRPAHDAVVHDAAPDHAMPVACHNAEGTILDRNLIETVARALRETGHPAMRSLDIEISGGVVILWGRVPSYYQKQLAQETVQRVAGVQGIANGIEVVCCR